MKPTRILTGLLLAVLACGSSSTNRKVGPKTGPDTNVVDDDPSNAPQTCDQAAKAGSYIGCEYWPTITMNPLVDPVFDFAVDIVNVGPVAASVKVDGPQGTSEETTVASGEISKIYLPWVDALKGSEDTAMTSGLVRGGAFHLVSDQPVVVYQFNAIEYAPQGGPAGKKWDCTPREDGNDCFSYTNDASLLFPTSALSTSYRLSGFPAVQGGGPGFVSVTAAQDDTTVTVKLGSIAGTLASTDGKVKAQSGGGSSVKYTLSAGDVLQLASAPGKDLSGSLVGSDKPVQVISGHSCANVPTDFGACDHLEEVVLPAEALGKRYVVATPTPPVAKAAAGHVVRFVGNVDGTKLTYSPSRPPGCPTTLDAGEVAECNDPSGDLDFLGQPMDATSIVKKSFVVEGDNEFSVSTYLVGQFYLYFSDMQRCALILDPDQQADCIKNDSSGKARTGDPSQTLVLPSEQFRSNYVFLAPDDYQNNFLDVTMEEGTELTLDGNVVTESFETVAGTSGVVRIKLDGGKDGAHTLSATAPVGIQVFGFGSFTSYAYPGGGDLRKIAPPPQIN